MSIVSRINLGSAVLQLRENMALKIFFLSESVFTSYKRFLVSSKYCSYPFQYKPWIKTTPFKVTVSELPIDTSSHSVDAIGFMETKIKSKFSNRYLGFCLET